MEAWVGGHKSVHERTIMGGGKIRGYTRTTVYTATFHSCSIIIYFYIQIYK